MSTFTTPTTQTARKAHRCNGCGRRIYPGETYAKQRGYDGAEVWTYKSCQHCDVVTAIWDPRDMDDEISEDGYLSWTDDAPRDVNEARAMAGWRHQWRTQSGKLWPLPARLIPVWTPLWPKPERTTR